MIHIFFLGLILGYGAAIPIGSVNLEMTRRNLKFGTKYGISLGLGASTADLTYLILLCSGAIVYSSRISFRFLASHFEAIFARSSLKKARNMNNYSCAFLSSKRANLTSI